MIEDEGASRPPRALPSRWPVATARRRLFPLGGLSPVMMAPLAVLSLYGFWLITYLATNHDIWGFVLIGRVFARTLRTRGRESATTASGITTSPPILCTPSTISTSQGTGIFASSIHC